MTLRETSLGESLAEAEVVVVVIVEVETTDMVDVEVMVTWVVVVDIMGVMEAVDMVLIWETHMVSPLSSLPALTSP